MLLKNILKINESKISDIEEYFKNNNLKVKYFKKSNGYEIDVSLPSKRVKNIVDDMNSIPSLMRKYSISYLGMNTIIIQEI